MSALTDRVATSAGGRSIPRPSTVQRASLFGVAWASLAQVVGLVIRLGSNLVLTRLLAPEMYGLFGTAIAVVTMLEWVSDVGVQPTLVRHPEGGSPEYLNTGWWLGVGRGLALTAFAAAAAWPLARLYGQPGLFPVLLALASRPALFAVRSPGLPRLRRELKYRALFIDEVFQTVIATAVSLVLAWQYRSIWAIVAGTLAGGVAGVAISYVICPVRPGLTWSRPVVREIAQLGRQIFVNTLVMALWLNLDRLLGLRFLTGTQMGYYAVAWNLAMVAEALTTRACDVYFSVLARQRDPAAQAAWHGRVCRLLATAAMPALACGVIAAPKVIDLLYDRRYEGARWPFAILGARMMVRTLGQVQFQYLLARAEVRLATRSYVVALAAQALILVPLVRAWGVAGLAFAGLLSTAVLTGTQSLLLDRSGARSLPAFYITLVWAAVGLAVAANL